MTLKREQAIAMGEGCTNLYKDIDAKPQRLEWLDNISHQCAHSSHLNIVSRVLPRKMIFVQTEA
jgi:hypothetical protein